MAGETWPWIIYSPGCLPIFSWQPICSLLGFLSNFSLGNFSLLFFYLNLNVKGRTFKEWYSILDCVLGQKNRLNIVLKTLSRPIFHHSMSLRQNCNFSETLHESMKNELNSPSSLARISIKLWNVTSLLECQNHYCLFWYFHEREARSNYFSEQILVTKTSPTLKPKKPCSKSLGYQWLYVK